MAQKSTDLPTWLPDGCPSWCIGDHFNGDGYEDRTHVNETIPITLTADELHLDEEPGVTMAGAESVPHVNLYLTQHYREDSPRIWVGKGGTSKGFYLTVEEASRLARALIGQVTAVRSGGQR